MLNTLPTRPISSYGLAKLAGEHGLRLVAARTGMQALSLRIANPYGPRQVVKGGQGFIAAAIRAIREKAPLEIWGDGSVTRDFIHIDDVAGAFVSAIASDIGTETLNSGSGASLREIVETLSELSGLPIKFNYRPARSVDVPSLTSPMRNGCWTGSRPWDFVKGCARRSPPKGRSRTSLERRRNFGLEEVHTMRWMPFR